MKATADHINAEPGSTVQPATNSVTSAGGSRLRLRLSTIFHRAIAGSVLGTGRPLSVGDGSPQPAHDLPVPSNPPVKPRGKRQVVRRVVVHQVDVGAESRPRVEALEEVVTEERVFGHASVERLGERIDVVDPLADEAALVKDVLIDVRDRARVRVDADVAGKDLRERGAARALAGSRRRAAAGRRTLR